LLLCGLLSDQFDLIVQKPERVGVQVRVRLAAQRLDPAGGEGAAGLGCHGEGEHVAQVGLIGAPEVGPGRAVARTWNGTRAGGRRGRIKGSRIATGRLVWHRSLIVTFGHEPIVSAGFISLKSWPIRAVVA
jgi:hypothetical protein